MAGVYKHLREQKFPALGQRLNIIAPLRKRRQKYAKDVLRNVSISPPSGQYPVFKLLANNMQRRNSALGRLLNYKQRTAKNDGDSTNQRGERWITKSIKRPIDFRFSGAPFCSHFKDIDDLIFLYMSILSEKRLIVVSSSLRYVGTINKLQNM